MDWGTPTTYKTIQIAGSTEQLHHLIPKMIQQRLALETQQKNNLQDHIQVLDSAERRAAINNSPLDLIKPGNPIPKDLIVHAMRAYLLGVPADDQQTISTLSRWKPWAGIWNPQHYTYGTFFLAASGATLGLGKVLGLLPKDFSIDWLLRSPDDVSVLYKSVRSLSALMNGITALLIYFLLSLRFPRPWPSWAAFIYLTSTLTIVQSHLAKPHALGCALILGGLYVYVRWNSKISLMILWGLSAASLITNYLAFLIGSFKIRQIFPILLGLAVSLLANYPLLFYVKAFLANAWIHHVTGYQQGHFVMTESWMYLTDYFRQGTSFLLVPFIFLGYWVLWREKEISSNLILTLSLSYFFLDILWFRHSGIGLISVALFSMIAAIGLQKIHFRPAAYFLGIALFSLQLMTAMKNQPCFVRYGNMTEAGEWINHTVPKNASIGLLGNNLSPATTPAFRFLDYEISLYHGDLADPKLQLPRYVITTGYSTNALPSFWSIHYKLLQQWPANPAETSSFLLGHENIGVSIWEKTS